MNQKDMINAVQQRAIQIRDGMHISKADVEAVFDALYEIVRTEMSTEGGEIPLPGLGKLKADTRAARTGRNPATGTEIEIPAKNVVKFSASKSLKDALA